MSMKTKLRKNDQVQVISGREKGKRGKILASTTRRAVSCRGRQHGQEGHEEDQKRPQGGIAEIEAAIAISNVMIVDKKGERTRLGYRIDGDRKVRISRKTKEEIG